LSEALRLLRSTGAAKWARLAELGPDAALGLEALERANPRHPMLQELNRLRADVQLARLVLRSRARPALDLALLLRAEAWLAANPSRDALERLGEPALRRELDRWVHAHQARLDDWFLERLAELPALHDRVAVFTWLLEGTSAPRPIHRLSRALRALDFVELASAVRDCPLDDESRVLHDRARLMLEQERRGVARPLERVLAVSPS
jgi:hypothetical protein